MNEEQNTPVANTEAVGKSGHGNSLLIVGVLGAVVVLAGLYYFFVFNSVTDPGLQPQAIDSPASTVDKDYPAVVAVVNGEEVSRDDLLPGLGQEMQLAAQQGADVTDATVQTQIEESVLDRLVNTVLLLQAAESNGITVTEEEVTAEYAQVAGQFEDVAAFETALAEQGLTEEQLRAELHDQLLLNAFIASDAFAQPSVTPEEIQAVYDEVAATQTDLPPLEEVSDEIGAQLAAQKQQAVIGSYIDSLRGEAEIEVRI